MVQPSAPPPRGVPLLAYASVQILHISVHLIFNYLAKANLDIPLRRHAVSTLSKVIMVSEQMVIILIKNKPYEINKS